MWIEKFIQIIRFASLHNAKLIHAKHGVDFLIFPRVNCIISLTDVKAIFLTLAINSFALQSVAINSIHLPSNSLMAWLSPGNQSEFDTWQINATSATS